MNSASRILVVDDEEDICSNLRDILTDFGYRVDVAYDGLTALALIGKFTYDLALLDLKMPGMDGLTLYRELKKLHTGAEAIIISAYASGEIADAALAAGAVRVMSKPVDIAELMPLVAEAVELPLILIVDDDRDLCESLAEIFSECGCRLLAVHSLAQLATRLKQSAIRVSLIDMKLPDGDGCEVVRLIREACPEARTVFISGYRHEIEKAIDPEGGTPVDAVCYKPLDIAKLLATVRSLLDRSVHKASS